MRSQWCSFHVHYHDDSDALLLDGVRPMLRQVAEAVDTSFFLRHWRLGPHLRLNVLCQPHALTDVVRPAVHDIVGGALARRPSRAALVPEEHLELHRRLALLEVEPGPLMPWRPDNSIHEQAHDARVSTVGSQDEADLLAGFYADTNDLVFDGLERIAAGDQRLAIAFDLMIATAHALSGLPLSQAFVSFHSHAEGFLHSPLGARGQRERWAAHYRAHSDALADRLRTLVATVDRDLGVAGSPSSVGSMAASWVARLRPYRARAARHVLDGRITDDPILPEESRALYADLDASPFHRRLLATPGWQRFRDSDGFALYRLMLNSTYLHLSRLGVAPEERFLLCYLAAHTVEDYYDVAPSDVIEQHPRCLPDLPTDVAV